MGVSNYDKEAGTKKYEVKYTLDTTEGVEKLLEDTHKIRSRALDRGDMAAIDLLVDLESAIELAPLTDKQRRVVELYYKNDLSQKATAALMDCDTSTVSRHRKAALKHITNVYKQWEYN
ncbi:sigma factor-like helix-turn-helix DNA-binding protein [Bacillus cereus]|uniref:sigma factor-like helix-turn-helix DNA-binding protein n=1 Tax=Bacillus cereus TaxID=1396 RepID=UPI0035CC15A8